MCGVRSAPKYLILPQHDFELPILTFYVLPFTDIQNSGLREVDLCKPKDYQAVTLKLIPIFNYSEAGVFFDMDFLYLVLLLFFYCHVPIIWWFYSSLLRLSPKEGSLNFYPDV